MDLSFIFLFLATVSGIAGYFVYLRDISNDTIAPNRWSWLIWSFFLGMEAFTYQAINQDWVKSAIFFLGVALCIAITLLIWKKAKWETPHWTETLSVLASLLALVLWLKFGFALWAHWLLLAMAPISFIPTWRNSIRNPENEDSHAWSLWVVCDIFTLLVILTRFTGVQELPLAVVDLIAHLGVLLLIRRRMR